MKQEWINKEDKYDVNICRKIITNNENEDEMILNNYDESYLPSMKTLDELSYNTVKEAIKYRKDNNLPFHTIICSVSFIDRLRRHTEKHPIDFGSSGFYKPIKIGEDILEIKIEENSHNNFYEDYRFKLLPKVKSIPKTLEESSWWINLKKNRKVKFNYTE